MSAATVIDSRGPRVKWTEVVTGGPPAGVEAGTLLGSGACDAADLAGEGTVALLRPGGRVEVRASRDGVPALSAEGVTVGRRHALEGNVDRAVGDRAVCGSLSIGGHVAPGRELSATGPIRVDGNIDRAEIRAGGELHIEGRAAGAALVGGAHAALRGRLHEPLRGVADEIDRLLDLASQLLRAAPDDGLVTPARVIRVLCAERFETLESRLVHARAIIISSGRDWPGLCAGLSAEVEAAHRAVAAPDRLRDPLGALTASAGFLAAAVPSRRPMGDVGVRLRAAHACSIETAGSLRLMGSGATDCDIAVGGDLIATGSGAALSGGEARVGGRVRVSELSVRSGDRMRVVIEDLRQSDDILRAGVVGAGVEVVVGGQTLRFDRRRSDVRIGVSGGRPVLSAA